MDSKTKFKESHVVMIGLNYQPKRSSSDKSFWVDIIPLLAKSLDRITVLSIRDHDHDLEQMDIDGCKIIIQYISPRILLTSDAAIQKNRSYKNSTTSIRWLFLTVEKYLQINSLKKKLNHIHNTNTFSHIHLMDTFGPRNRSLASLARSLDCSISVSLMSYRGLMPFINHAYVRMSNGHPHLITVASSMTLRDKLLRLGIRKDNVRQIPWGVLKAEKRSDKFKREYKTKYGFHENRPLFLWAGNIQQIKERDFYFALEKAQKAINSGLIAQFCFAFKPGSMREVFNSFNDPEKHIQIMRTSENEFAELRIAADIFYSPVVNTNAILGPPLTWIEVLAQGTPILTTNFLGSGEFIEDGVNGFVAADDEDLIHKMHILCEVASSLSTNCIEKVGKNYNVIDIAKRYIELWL